MQLDRLNRKLEGLEKASKNGHRVKDLYRMMYLAEIWQEAYANIYSNKGALTRGVDDVTLDGMSHERIDHIIEKLKARKYIFRPVKRIYIPKIIEFCNKRGYGDWHRFRPTHRVELVDYPDVEIIYIYNVELRGFANYYSLAYNMRRRLNRLQYLSNYSLVKTLAYRHKAKMSSILKQLKQGNEWTHKYRSGDKDYEMKVFKLKHMIKPEKHWEVDNIPKTFCLTSTESELVKRLNARICEYCGRDDLPAEVHHVRKLKDLRKKRNLKHWQKVLIARNRKTMILCSGTPDSCHYLLHAGKLPDKRFNSKWI
jgi:hypothetical protein